MKISLLPKTNAGRFSVALMGIAIFLFFCRFLVKCFLVELYISSIDIPGFLVTSSLNLIWFIQSLAFITGIFAFKNPSEKSILVSLSTILGFIIFIYGVLNFFAII